MSIKGKGHIVGPGIEESNCNLCLTTYNNDERGASISIFEDKEPTFDEKERRREHYITIDATDTKQLIKAFDFGIKREDIDEIIEHYKRIRDEYYQ